MNTNENDVDYDYDNDPDMVDYPVPSLLTDDQFYHAAWKDIDADDYQHGLPEYSPLTNENDRCFIYLITDGVEHKIGKSAGRIAGRLKTLTSQTGKELTAITRSYWMNDETVFHFETSMHHHFADQRTQGEWFLLSARQVVEAISLMHIHPTDYEHRNRFKKRK